MSSGWGFGDSRLVPLDPGRRHGSTRWSWWSWFQVSVPVYACGSSLSGVRGFLVLAGMRLLLGEEGCVDCMPRQSALHMIMVEYDDLLCFGGVFGLLKVGEHLFAGV